MKTYWFIFYQEELLLDNDQLPYSEEPPVSLAMGGYLHTLPPLDGVPCKALHLKHPYQPEENSSPQKTESSHAEENGKIRKENSYLPEKTGATWKDKAYLSEENGTILTEKANPLEGNSVMLEEDFHPSEKENVTLEEEFHLSEKENVMLEEDFHLSEGKSVTLKPVGLRASYFKLPLSHYLHAGKAREVLHFDEQMQFCPRCGHPLTLHEQPNTHKECDACNHQLWPSISTAIIVRITRGEEILLVRARNFRGTFYGLVAGFLETGETLEECVAREVKEETGISIKNLRYFASQPWPYPSGLMVGFTAEYAGGTIRIQDEELTEARFFHRTRLPEIPPKLSMARMLIDDFIEKNSAEGGN